MCYLDVDIDTLLNSKLKISSLVYVNTMSGYQVPSQKNFNVLPIYPIIAPNQRLGNVFIENLEAYTGTFGYLEVTTGALIQVIETEETDSEL